MPELRTPLEIATQSSDLPAIQARLVQGDTPQDLNHLGIPVLYDALKTNRLDIMDSLDAAGLDLSTPYNQNGYTPLIYACLFCEIGVVDWLLAKGLDINEKTSLGISPMHVAAQRGEPSIATHLYNLGADVFCRTRHGESPLLVSLTSRRGLDVFKFILQCYRHNEREVGSDLMRCIAYVFEKQHAQAINAVIALLPFAVELPNEPAIRQYMSQPGNYSSAGIRSLDNTLNTSLSRALFALLKSERISRASNTDAKSTDHWEAIEGL
ncbi:MAG: ankyrin repeat domain-containing protein [Pseudomonadota bacterium]